MPLMEAGTNQMELEQTVTQDILQKVGSGHGSSRRVPASQAQS
jgi:hypothetical protein